MGQRRRSVDLEVAGAVAAAHLDRVCRLCGCYLLFTRMFRSGILIDCVAAPKCRAAEGNAC